LAEKNQVYQCSMYGNLMEVPQGGNGKRSCCGQMMVLLKDVEAKATKGK